MQATRRASGFEIAPLRGLRYDLARARPEALTAPPYDVISPDEHRRLLAAEPHNITRITLGAEPGGASSYDERARLLQGWIREGVLVADDVPGFYAYVIDYPVPGSSAGPGGVRPRSHFVGLLALGKLHPFSGGIVLPHERTFPKVVEDRLNLLDATRTQLESIFVLYADPEHEIERLVEAQCRGEPVIRVEAKPGEHHALHRISDVAAFIRLTDFFGTQRPIIADGHHRYTTSLRFLEERARGVPGAGWQLMTLANLYSDGLSILATHRLVKVKGDPRAVLDRLLRHLEVAQGDDRDLTIETRERQVGVRFPAALRQAKSGVARTSYALLQDVVIGEWLKDVADEAAIRYFKEATGESEALARGDGDILFRMQPVDRREFQEVAQGGEVFPHKTTYFYPKLWSGLVLWPLAEPERLALK